MNIIAAFALALAAFALPDKPAPARPFAVTVVDGRTGRGIPLVELRTVNEVRYVTDSAGVAAVVEPGLEGQAIYFHVRSHGYEFPADGFGYRGKALTVAAGGSARLEVRRLNVAERLYRVTGAGIYRDSLLCGLPTPTREPALNARVMGSDSVQTARHRGKLYWFWGDTNRPDYPLGNFHVPGATSDLPGQGGLDPFVGVDLHYFKAPDGFAAETARMPGDGPTWVFGLAPVVDDDGREVLAAGYSKIRGGMQTYEHGVVAFDPDAGRFRKVATLPLDAPVRPAGAAFRLRDGGEDYVYYAEPFPLTRVPARLSALADPRQYQAFTCLATGSRLDRPEVDRGPDGRARYAWRADAPAVGPAEQQRLIRDGLLKPDEALIGLRDAETGKPVLAHRGSVSWNAYRGRWVAVVTESGGGPSFLGEVWYAEADTPLGPWADARKVVTHDRYSFYNPVQHPEFSTQNGRMIYFEGTYTATFSGNPDPTPRYDYNQIMYRLDLDDPRLNLPAAPSTPVPVGEDSAGGLSVGSTPYRPSSKPAVRTLFNGF